jgi:hypothetical protein
MDVLGSMDDSVSMGCVGMDLQLHLLLAVPARVANAAVFVIARRTWCHALLQSHHACDICIAISDLPKLTETLRWMLGAPRRCVHLDRWVWTCSGV